MLVLHSCLIQTYMDGIKKQRLKKEKHCTKIIITHQDNPIKMTIFYIGKQKKKKPLAYKNPFSFLLSAPLHALPVPGSCNIDGEIPTELQYVS